MELNELRGKAREMLSVFVDSLGLNGEYFSSLATSCPMVWGNAPVGKYLSPNSKLLNKELKKLGCDKESEDVINEKGLIVINKKYEKSEIDFDFYVTIIHEMLHSHRNLMLDDVVRDGKNENAYTFVDGRYETNTQEQKISYVDASQEILKGSIDTSNQNLESYKNMNSDQVELLDNWQEHKEDKMEKQYMIDESLVELMAFLSVVLHRSKEKGETPDIWKVLEKAKDFYEGEDIGAVCKIILKHHDLELFNWMLDPISYSNGDIHYDFFEEYTREDQDLVQELYELSIRSREDEFGFEDEDIDR